MARILRPIEEKGKESEKLNGRAHTSGSVILQIDCFDSGEELYSTPSQASAVINRSQFSPAVRNGAYASWATIAPRSDAKQVSYDSLSMARASGHPNR